MSKPFRGSAWWQSLHPWHKMAVILTYPNLSSNKLSDELQLVSRNCVIRVRERIKGRIKLKKTLPAPCKPEDVADLVIPPDAPIHKPPRTTPGRQLMEKLRQRELRHAPFLLEPACKKVMLCCTKDCNKTALPKLAFCAVCAPGFYKSSKQKMFLVAPSS